MRRSRRVAAATIALLCIAGIATWILRSSEDSQTATAAGSQAAVPSDAVTIASFPSIDTAPETSDPRALQVAASAAKQASDLQVPIAAQHVKAISVVPEATLYAVYDDKDSNICIFPIVAATGGAGNLVCDSFDRVAEDAHPALGVGIPGEGGRVVYMFVIAANVTSATATGTDGVAVPFELDGNVGVARLTGEIRSYDVHLTSGEDLSTTLPGSASSQG